MKTLKQDWLIWLIMLAPLPFIALYWNEFPDRIPTHFNASGMPDDYSSRAFGLFFIPCLNIGMYFLFYLLPLIDPRRKNYALFSDKYRIIRFMLHIFMSFLFFVIAFFSLGYHINIGMCVLYGILVLFLVMGNYMGNIRANYFIGIRTPWTLNNEENWNRTHRFAGRLWVAATLVMMVILPFVPEVDVFFISYVFFISLLPMLYSYLIYRKSKGG